LEKFNDFLFGDGYPVKAPVILSLFPTIFLDYVDAANGSSISIKWILDCLLDIG